MEQGFEEEKSIHVFRVENPINIEEGVVEQAKLGIAMAWNEKIGTPTTFNLVFADHIVDGKGKPINRASEYDPDLDKIKFAVKSDSFRSFNLSQRDAVLLASAHEATHKAQFARGEEPKPSKDYENPEEYVNDPHELEAWDEALHVFKKVHPNAGGGLTLYGRRFEVPHEVTK